MASKGEFKINCLTLRVITHAGCSVSSAGRQHPDTEERSREPGKPISSGALSRSLRSSLIIALPISGNTTDIRMKGKTRRKRTI